MSRNRALCSLLVASITLCLACGAELRTDPSETRARLEAVDREIMAAFAVADAPSVAAAYTEDAQLLPPGAARVVGREAIERFWQDAMDAGVAQVELEPEDTDVQGDTAYQVGRRRFSTAGGSLIDEGKHVVVWKLRGGSWKYHREIWNSDRPVP